MNEPNMKIASFCALILISFGGIACASDGSAASDAASLDSEVPRLSSGASVQEVEEEIGAPRAHAELEDGEMSLYYGLWQLIFDPDLKVRIRSFKAGYWPPGRSFKALDEGVAKLKAGASKHTVEETLGKPEAWEIKDFKQREVLWYGNGRWKLVLRNSKLAAKTRSRQVS
jgi:hypothetical protein